MKTFISSPFHNDGIGPVIGLCGVVICSALERSPP